MLILTDIENIFLKNQNNLFEKLIKYRYNNIIILNKSRLNENEIDR